MVDLPPYDWARLATVKGQPRSVSQAQQYLEDLGGCRYRYFLSRVIRAWDRPAAWLPQGLGVHEAAEWWERGKREGSLETMKDVYRRSYRDHTARLLENTPNVSFWFASGRYEGQKDIDRRAELGLEQVERYYNYYVNQKPGEVIWLTPDGSPAIELEFNEYFGSVLVKGYIDQIIDEITETDMGDPIAAQHEPNVKLRDIKTGVSPGNMFQLSVYRHAVLSKYGVDILSGDYWMGKTGKATKPYNLGAMSKEQVTEYFERLDAGVKAEDFEPSPSVEKCGRCGVRTACQFAA
jgi:putative RecB family exonuclease